MTRMCPKCKKKEVWYFPNSTNGFCKECGKEEVHKVQLRIDITNAIPKMKELVENLKQSGFSDYLANIIVFGVGVDEELQRRICP